LPENNNQPLSRVHDGRLLTLAMIVRDGGQNLAPLLAGARPWVDEIVIGDTGSRDDSVSVAENLGARVHHISWQDDFAAARNQVLAHCHGAWILSLDADELLCQTDWRDLRAWVSTMADKNRQMAGNIVTRNYLPDRCGRRGWTPVPVNDAHALPEGPPAEGFVTTTKVRLFPNQPAIRFRGPIHETVEASLWEARIAVEDLPWPVHHFGYLQPSAEKNRRYLHLAHRKTTEQPHSAQAWAELADCAITTGDHRQALVAIERSLVLDPSDAGRRLTAGWLLMNTGDFTKSELQLATVVGYPDVDKHLLAEASHLRAQIAIQCERPRAAVPLLATALRLFPDNGHFQNTLGTLNLMLGRSQAARQALQLSCELLPHHAEPCLNFALLLEAAGQPEQAAEYFSEALRRDPTNERAIAAVKKFAPVPIAR